MKTKYVIIFLLVLLTVSMITSFMLILKTSDPFAGVFAGCCWVVVLMCVFGFMALFLRQKRDYDSLREHTGRELESLTQNLMSSSLELSDRNVKLRDNESVISHITKLNDSYKSLIAYLRTELRSEHAKLQESYQLLDELRERAELSDRLKAAFLANIDHELRTPLNGILGPAALIGSTSFSPEKREQFISLMTKSCYRFLDTVNDVFYYSKLQVGDVNTSTSTFDVNLMMANVVNQGHNWIAAQGKQIELKVLTPIQKANYIQGFENGLYKILTNLLNNAIKFTKSGTVTIGYTITGQVIRFDVTDTGIGFDPAKRETIFGSFKQSEDKLSRQYEGTGLGLSICRTLVRLMNGNISADSHPGEGSHFWFAIPLVAVQDKGLDIFKRVDEMLSSIETGGHILVVTPYDEDFLFIKNFYEAYNLQVVRTSSPAQLQNALAHFDDIRMAIIDIFSSDMKGFDVASRIFEDCPKVKSVFMHEAEFSDEQLEQVNLFSGVSIQKPLTSMDLGSIYINS